MGASVSGPIVTRQGILQAPKGESEEQAEKAEDEADRVAGDLHADRSGLMRDDGAEDGGRDDHREEAESDDDAIPH